MSLDETVRELVRQALEKYDVASPAPAGQPSSSATEPASLRSSGNRAAVGIAVGADHGGYALKDRIARQLADEGYTIRDCGTNGPEPVDYPDFAHAVAELVSSGACQWGIIVDGAGIGSCMVANKVPGVRAALCHDVSSARNAREHNHANVLTLGARMVGEGLALDIVRTWITTPWGPGRHTARVEKIAEIERRYLKKADQAT